METKWWIVIAASLGYLHLMFFGTKVKSGKWLSMGIDMIGAALARLFFTLLYAIFWIVWLIIF